MQLKTLLILLLVQLIAFQLSAQDYKKVQAKNGDGIYSLLRRYSLNPSEYLDDFVALNKKTWGKIMSC
jgi:N-acetylmuramoyl-L-alanine amidase